MSTKSRAKRAARQHKSRHRDRACSPVGGLFLFGEMAIRAEDKKPLLKDQQKEISVAHWISFEALIHAPYPTCYQLETIGSALNIGLILCEMGIGGDDIELLFQRALDGVFRAKLRGEKLNRWRLDGAAIEDVRICLELHDQQLELATKAEVKQAILTVDKRISEGHVYTGTYNTNQPTNQAQS